jgi:hypothetical protein
MASSATSPYEVASFTGGITDDVFKQDNKFCKEMDNLLIGGDEKPLSRAGSIIEDSANPQLPSGIQRVGTLINYANSDKLFYQSGKKIYYRNPSAFTTLQGPSGNDVFSTGALTDMVSFTQWNRHLFVTNGSYPRPMKIYKDSSGVYNVRTSSQPALASSPAVLAGAVGTNNYLYAFHYFYEYTVTNQTFQDFGPTTIVSLENADEPAANPVGISSIPVISNGATDNWDTTNIKVYIYRSISGGTLLYKIGEVTNGTTTFTDTVPDDIAQTGLSLYTNDGTLDFDPAPQAKFVHVVNSTGYYGGIKEGSEEFLYKIRQSVPGNPSACPADFELDVEDIIQGVSSVKSLPIILCSRHIYRVENAFDVFGRGFMQGVRISDTAGCVSNLSIVQAENGLFWAGHDGFYYSDGYQVIKISDHLNDTYKTILSQMTQSTHIYGRYDEKERNIYWCIEQNSGNLDNDSMIVLDLKWGISNNCSFTTFSGNSFRPTSIEFFGGTLYRGDSRGYIFKHDAAYVTDPKVNTAAAVSLWSTETIIWTYESIDINFNGTFFRKLPTKVLVQAKNLGNTTIQLTAVNDSGKITRACKPIRIRTNFTWGDPNFVWGNPDCVWNSVGFIEQWRRLPAKGLRLSYMNLIITNGFAVIDSSDISGTATFSPSLNQATLDAAASSWGNDIVDYVIATEVDNYVKEYTVTVRNSATVLTVADPDNTFPIGSLKWVMRGFQKGESLGLLGYNIHWSDISQTQTTYESGDSGENAS